MCWSYHIGSKDLQFAADRYIRRYSFVSSTLKELMVGTDEHLWLFMNTQLYYVGGYKSYTYHFAWTFVLDLFLHLVQIKLLKIEYSQRIFMHFDLSNLCPRPDKVPIFKRIAYSSRRQIGSF